ncbi:MAG: ABC transporter permease [Anaerolineae bacterium]|nr:ABC transporter permease [Anaerolineae bacterium]
MLKARWYKVINDLTGNKTRTLLIVLSIAVGLVALGTILSAQSILSDGLARSFAAINPSSGTVRTLELFDEDFLQSVRAMPDVQSADARRNLSARIKVGSNDWKNISLFIFPDYNDIQVNKVTSQVGVWPPPKHELLIERAAMSVIDAKIGDTVIIKLPDDTERELTITGTAYDPAQMPAPFDGTPYGYISFDTLYWMGQQYGFNELHVVSTHPENKLWAGQVVNRVKDKTEKSGYTIPLSMTAEPGQLPMNDILQAILMLMGALGLMSLFLSIFLIINTVSSILTQQRRQIGVMKAIGGSSAQILGMYLMMVTSYGLLALLVAIPLSIFSAGGLSQMLASYFNFDLTAIEIQPHAILTQIIIGLLLPVLASLYPFLSSLGISAAEAMSAFQTGKGRYGTSLIDRLLSGSNLWFTRFAPVRSILLSVRNIFRSKGRLVLTLLTLTLGAATFISVFSVRSSLTRTVDDMIKWMNFDIMLTFDRPYRAERVESEALQVPGVTATDVWLQLPVRRVRLDGSESGMMYLFAPHADSRLILAPGITAGRWLTPEDENAVVVGSGMFIDEPDLHLGSEVTLKINGRKYPFKIVGVSVGSSFGSMIYINYNYVARLTDRADEADSLMIATHGHDAGYVEALSSGLEKHFEDRGLRISTVTTMTTEKAEANVIFDSIVVLLLSMAILLALVGGLGLLGTMSINVLERTREIGVMRAYGASSAAISRIVILEGLLIGMLSWILAIGLSLPLSVLLARNIGEAFMDYPMPASVSTGGILAWAALVLVISIVASLFPALNAVRLTVTEVLAYE